jgi:hypothetical protein
VRSDWASYEEAARLMEYEKRGSVQSTGRNGTAFSAVGPRERPAGRLCTIRAIGKPTKPVLVSC